MNTEQKLPIQKLIPGELDTIFSKEHLLVMKDTHTTLRKLCEIINTTFFPEGIDDISRSLRQAAKNSGMHDTQWAQDALEELRCQKRMGIANAALKYKPFGEVAIDSLNSIRLKETRRTELTIVARVAGSADISATELSEIRDAFSRQAKDLGCAGEKWMEDLEGKLQIVQKKTSSPYVDEAAHQAAA